MRCGWCGNKDQESGTNCRTCGGPLPAPEDAHLGPAPPPAPRPLPARFGRRELVTANAGFLVGLAFGCVGGIFPLIFAIISFTVPAMLPAAAMCLIFPLPGAIISGLSWRLARRRVALLRDGAAAVGTITSIEDDTSQTINGRHPLRLSYLFEVGGQRHGGSVTSVNVDLRRFTVGHPIHVLHASADPERSDVWPVIAR